MVLTIYYKCNKENEMQRFGISGLFIRFDLSVLKPRLGALHQVYWKGLY